MHPRAVPRRLFAPLMVVPLALLGACQPADPPAAAALPATMPEALQPADAPLAAAGMEDAAVGLSGAAVRAYLVSQYGELAQLSGDWPGTPVAGQALGDAPALREVCARAGVGTVAAPAELVAVCGIPDGAGHVTAAITDFFLLSGDPAAPTAKAHLQVFGSTGDIADIEIRRFGPDLHGFVIDSGFTGQGLTVLNRSIVLPRAATFHEAATLPGAIDNRGAMHGCAERDDCDPDAAFDVTFDFVVDNRDAAATAWPLRVRERGEVCGRQIDTTHAVPFDAATATWSVPAALQRSGCD